MMIRNKKAAMEMSVGTIVTIVLLMSVLVLGIFLVQKVFKTGTGAVDAIDASVNAEIDKLFGDTDARIILFPNSGIVDVEKGGERPSGFAFAVKNDFKEDVNFNYEINALSTYDYASHCGSTVTQEKAQSFIDIPKGLARTSASGKSGTKKAFFTAPESIADCMVPYEIVVYDEEGGYYADDTMRVNFK